MRKYRLLLLDFDGVISDSLRICMEEINYLARKQFHSVPEVCSREDMVKVYSVKLKHSLYRFGLDDEQTRDFLSRHSQAMNRRAAEIEPFHEVIQGIANCSLPKIIITSSYSSAVYTILQKSSRFDRNLIQRVYGGEQRINKTRKIWDALKLFSTKSSDALFVGDLVSDILYCRDVPIDIACVGYGYHPSDYLIRFAPTYLLETIEDFVKFLLDI